MSETLALFGGPKAFTRADELGQACAWPLYGEKEKAAVLAALEGGNVYAPTAAFQEQFRQYMGTKYCLPTCNGTSAIHSAYFAAGVQPGDEVIVSAHTWHLGVTQIIALHGIPVFADIEPRAACMDPADVARKISDRTRAICVVHPYGAVAPMDEINAIAKEHGLAVIEDASHAHGARYKGRKVGTLGDIGCFSLQGSKLMSGIEAGVLVTDNTDMYERAALLGHYELIPSFENDTYKKYNDPTKEMAPANFGFKYRINPLAAALASVQLSELDERNAIRQRNARYLTTKLNEAGGDVFHGPYEAPETERTWLNFICQYFADTAGVSRERFIEALAAEGLPVTTGRAGYLPIYWNPIYEERSVWAPGYPFDAPYTTRKITYERGLCPEAERYPARQINLPVVHHDCGLDLLDDYVEAVAKVLRNLDALK